MCGLFGGGGFERGEGEESGLCVCVVCVCVCVCVCRWVWRCDDLSSCIHFYTFIHKHTHTHTQVHLFATTAIKRLQEKDQKLPQVRSHTHTQIHTSIYLPHTHTHTHTKQVLRILDLCRRGIGVHHGGFLLPLLKTNPHPPLFTHTHPPLPPPTHNRSSASSTSAGVALVSTTEGSSPS
jgi:hypothetical protein